MHDPWTKPNDCAVCGRKLSIIEALAGPVCCKPLCRSTRLRQDAKAQAEKQRTIWNQAAALTYAHLLRKHRVETPEQIAHARVPANLRALVVVAEKRRRRFRDRLQKIISRAVAALATGRDIETTFPQHEQASMTAGQEGLLAHACATCRGSCCHEGRDHAFIDEALIQRYIRAHPGVRPRHVLDAYLSRIGSRSYEQSCIYHGATGCTLPHAMRADICNQYLCQGLKSLLDRLREDRHDRAFVLASTETTPTRAAIFGPGFRHQCDVADTDQVNEAG